jgi:hypothetical protein
MASLRKRQAEWQAKFPQYKVEYDLPYSGDRIMTDGDEPEQLAAVVRKGGVRFEVYSDLTAVACKDLPTFVFRTPTGEV